MLFFVSGVYLQVLAGDDHPTPLMTLSPNHSPLSCGQVRWWICPPCTFGCSRMRARISNLKWFCSSRRKYRRPRADPSEEPSLLQDHTPHWPQSWRDRHGLGCLGRIYWWARHGWLSGPGSGHMSMSCGNWEGRRGMSSCFLVAPQPPAGLVGQKLGLRQGRAAEAGVRHQPTLRRFQGLCSPAPETKWTQERSNLRSGCKASTRLLGTARGRPWFDGRDHF